MQTTSEDSDNIETTPQRGVNLSLNGVLAKRKINQLEE